MSQLATLKQVAAQAGVSYQTVSKVLNGQIKVGPETLARIQAAVEALGYRPNPIARSMRLQRSRMIGYSWTPAPPEQVNNILDAFLSSMVEEAERAGYHLLPFPAREGETPLAAYRDLIDSGRVDGFVLSSVNYADARIAYLLERGFPFVAFGRSDQRLAFPFVDVDGAGGLRQAVAHLVGAGHRRVAAIAWPEESRVGNERLAGYHEGMAAAGLEVCPEWIRRGEGTVEFGRAALGQLLDLPEGLRPSAAVACNDAAAIGALQALRARGLQAGRDLAVIGFDDAPMAQFLDPPLSSVRQPIRAAGRACVEMLVELMEGRQPERSCVLLPPELVVRESG